MTVVGLEISDELMEELKFVRKKVAKIKEEVKEIFQESYIKTLEKIEEICRKKGIKADIGMSLRTAEQVTSLLMTGLLNVVMDEYKGLLKLVSEAQKEAVDIFEEIVGDVEDSSVAG